MEKGVEAKESPRIKREEKIYEISTSHSFSDSLSFLRSYPPIRLKDRQKYSYKKYFLNKLCYFFPIVSVFQGETDMLIHFQ